MKLSISLSADDEDIADEDFPVFGYASHMDPDKNKTCDTTISVIERLAQYGHLWAHQVSNDERPTFHEVAYFFKHLDTEPAAAAKSLRKGRRFQCHDADADGYVAWSPNDMDDAMEAAMKTREERTTPAEKSESKSVDPHKAQIKSLRAQIKTLSDKLKQQHTMLKTVPKIRIMKRQSIRANIIGIEAQKEHLAEQITKLQSQATAGAGTNVAAAIVKLTEKIYENREKIKALLALITAGAHAVEVIVRMRNRVKKLEGQNERHQAQIVKLRAAS